MTKMPNELQQKIIKALRSDGCLITVTEKRDGELNHYQYHRTFPRGDFEISLQGIKALLLPFGSNKNENVKSTVKEY